MLRKLLPLILVISTLLTACGGASKAEVQKLQSQVETQNALIAQALATDTPQPPTPEPTPDIAQTVQAGVNNVLATLQAGQGGAVVSTQLVSGFPTTAEEFWAMIYVPCPAGTLCLNLEVNEVSQCPGESHCWRAPREKDMNAVITPYMGRNPSTCVQDGWMHSSADRAALGRKAPPTAVGSGVPEGYQGLIEGITFRPCEYYPADTTVSSYADTPVPSAPRNTVAAPRPASTFPQTVEEFARVYEIKGLDLSKIEACPGEGNCWRVTLQPEFTLHNVSTCAQDGAWRDNGTERYGIPAGYNGPVVAFTIRPCK